MKPSLVATEVPLSVPERRRFPRYRYSAPLIVRAANVAEARGMTVEISECGASVIVGALLKVGDTVELEPVGGGIASAVVRRGLGRLYGFEFLNLSAEQAGKIREMGKTLPAYRSKTLDLWQR
jgi:PilZ domain